MTNKKKTTYIRFLGAINEKNIRTLINNIDQKVSEKTDRFVIMISSGGGNVFFGLSAYNYLRGIPADVITHNFGSVNSVAIVLYCSGTIRYCVPHAMFLMHGVAAGFPQNANLEASHLEERLKALRMDEENIAGVIAEHTKKSEEQIIQDMSKRIVLNPEKAVEYGLVTDIKKELYEKGAELINIQ